LGVLAVAVAGERVEGPARVQEGVVDGLLHLGFDIEAEEVAVAVDVAVAVAVAVVGGLPHLGFDSQ